MRKKYLSLALALAMCLGLLTVPASAASAQAVWATPTNDALVVDGVTRNATVYKINGSNYFKIRDLAAVLNGTSKQFGVGYDSASKSVTATPGQSYTKLGTDLTGAASGRAVATPSNDTILVNGRQAQNITVYKINGSNYFKLRDLGNALGFPVDYDKSIGMIINTSNAPAVTYYKGHPDVPDFGAYFNVSLAHSSVEDSGTQGYDRCEMYHYDPFATSEALTAKGGIDSYFALLEKNGYIYIGDIKGDDGKTRAVYDKPDLAQSVILGYARIDYSSFTQDYFVVFVYDGVDYYKGKNVTYYADHPDIPDFGAYFGIPLADIEVSTNGESYKKCTVYCYDALKVYALGEDENKFNGYFELLQAKGYTYTGSIVDDYGYTNHIYKRGNQTLDFTFEKTSTSALRYSVYVFET